MLRLNMKQEKLALDKGLSIEQLEGLAQDTWEDSLSWFTIQKLLNAHQKTISKAQADLKALTELVGLKDGKDQLQRCLEELQELETIVSQDFTKREQNISSLVYNIIGVQNAQAAQAYSESIGRITWISFIFFPLIAVSVCRFYPPADLVKSTDKATQHRVSLA